MVGLDLTKMDEHLVRYAFFITKIVKTVDKVFFVHISSNNNQLPENLRETYPEIQAKSQEVIIEQMKKLAAKYESQFPESQFETIVKAIHGDPLTQILHLSKKHQIDLILTGRKNVLDGSGLLTRKLARRALCSVLCIPKNVKTEMSKIFVPIDFSDYSKVAMEYALQFIDTHPETEILCHHVYRLPNGYYASGKSVDAFGKIMKENARETWTNFIGQFDIGDQKVSIKYAFDPKGTATARMSYNTALVEHVDMILLGSKGRTRAAAALLGSFAEKLLLENTNLPLFILKGKKKNLDILAALMKL